MLFLYFTYNIWESASRCAIDTEHYMNRIAIGPGDWETSLLFTTLHGKRHVTN